MDKIQTLLSRSAEYSVVFPIDVHDRRTTFALVEWLHDRGVTYSEMAKFSGLSEAGFSHWRRRTSPRLKEQAMIVNALNMPREEHAELERGLSPAEYRAWQHLMSL